jgi:uncharacterized protein
MPPKTLPFEEIRAFAQANGIRRIALFGSRLRGSGTPESDVDLLIELPPGHNIGLLRMAEMEAELEALIGVKVDLRTPADLSPHFRDAVLSEAEVLYVAA